MLTATRATREPCTALPSLSGTGVDFSIHVGDVAPDRTAASGVYADPVRAAVLADPDVVRLAAAVRDLTAQLAAARTGAAQSGAAAASAAAKVNEINRAIEGVRYSSVRTGQTGDVVERLRGLNADLVAATATRDAAVKVAASSGPTLAAVTQMLAEARRELADAADSVEGIALNAADREIEAKLEAAKAALHEKIVAAHRKDLEAVATLAWARQGCRRASGIADRALATIVPEGDA